MSWYKRAKQDKKPYDIFLISPEGSRQIGDIMAFSEAQARKFFLINPPKDYNAYLEMGYTIIARLNKEEFDRLQRIKEYEEKREEETVQNAWWNN